MYESSFDPEFCADNTDNCGVCDNDPSNDCVQDCADEWGGSAAMDCVGVCVTEPVSTCTDCLGEVGGTAKLDNCGVCDNDPNNDCDQDCVELWGECYSVDNTVNLHLYIDADVSPDQDILIGKIPRLIGKLVNLRSIILYGNLLTGEVPSEIGNLDSLRTLDLNSNQLTSLPESIGNLTNLELLYIDRNQLTSLPESIENLINLQKLNLRNNQLTNLPDSIGNLVNLEWFDVSDNQLTSIPNSICDFDIYAMSTLQLVRNPLCRDAIPDCLIDIIFYESMDTTNCDCAGITGGDAVADNCGTCDNDSTNDCEFDCAGVYGGTSWVSDCGCVLATNSGNDCDDCAGTPDGTVVEDCVGVCGGSTDFCVILGSWLMKYDFDCDGIFDETTITFNDDLTAESETTNWTFIFSLAQVSLSPGRCNESITFSYNIEMTSSSGTVYYIMVDNQVLINAVMDTYTNGNGNYDGTSTFVRL